MNSLQEMFQELVQDIHSAEKQLMKALPKVIKNCQNEELKNGIQQHLEVTKSQAERVEQLCKELGFKAAGKLCKGMQGIVEESNEHLAEGKPGPAMDAMIIANCQKAEHYEMCNYGTAASWAKELGMSNAHKVLGDIYQEECDADSMLNRIAEGTVNRDAARAPVTEEKKATSRAKSTGSSPRGKVSMR